MAKILDLYKNAKSYLSKEMRVFNGSSTSKTLPFMANWMYMAKMGLPRQINIVELRQYSKSAWVQMVINTICKQIMTTDWGIVVDDEDEEEDNNKFDKDIERAITFLNQPNRNGDAFWDVWIPWLRDVLELDAGVVFKGWNVIGELVELYCYDGSRFLVNINEYGIIGEDKLGNPEPGYYQYSFRQISAAPVPFNKNEIVYGRMNTNTELFPYGFSPLQSIQQEVELMIQSTRFNKERFANSAVPDGIVSVPMDQEQMLQFRNAWENEVKGRPHKLIFHNSDATFTPLAMSNKDMEWLEGQKWYFHLVFGAYGLSPMEAGFYESGNRATGESQERTTVKNAIKPYLELIASKINREILPDLLGHDELRFKWFANDDAAEKVEHDQMMSMLNANVLTINEVRNKEGLDPVEWGDRPMMMSIQQANTELGNSNNPKDNKPNDNNRDDNKDKRDESKEDAEKTRNKSYKSIDAGEDLIEESKDYEDFLIKQFTQWETSIFSFLDKTIKDELLKDVNYMDKSFGEFIRQLFNNVNTIGFRQGLISTIKATMKEGVNDAEKELNVDIGFGPEMLVETKILADRQLEGFYIENKRWAGLKGVAADVQLEVSQIVRDGIVGREDIGSIKSKIQEKLDITKNRATTIARTETNRFMNHSKVMSYQKSGIVKELEWDAFHDNRTSKICEELDKKRVPIGKYFTLESGQQFAQPPAHPNCRSVVQPVFVDED